jgi:hypothetical protein
MPETVLLNVSRNSVVGTETRTRVEQLRFRASIPEVEKTLISFPKPRDQL